MRYLNFNFPPILGSCFYHFKEKYSIGTWNKIQFNSSYYIEFFIWYIQIHIYIYICYFIFLYFGFCNKTLGNVKKTSEILIFCYENDKLTQPNTKLKYLQKYSIPLFVYNFFNLWGFVSYITFGSHCKQIRLQKMFLMICKY